MTVLLTCAAVVFQVRLKCVQSFISILQHPDRQVAPPYIQGLAPRMMEHLHSTASATSAPTENDLQLTLEELGMMETLVALAEDNKRKWEDGGGGIS